MGNIRNLDIKPYIHQYNTQIYLSLGAGYGTDIFNSLVYPFSNILSVEIIEEQVELLQKFFRFDNRVKIFCDTTENFLKQVLPKIPINTNLFIYCDAHFKGADMGFYDFDEEKNEDLKLPLFRELNIIKELWVDRGGQSVIIADDISLFDRSDRKYESDHKLSNLSSKIMPQKYDNYLPKFINLFKDTHNSKILTKENGWLILTPK